MLVRTSLGYLDSLAGKPAAIRTWRSRSRPAIATGRPQGDVYGRTWETRRRVNNLRKARSMLDALDATRPADLKLQRERRELALATARLLRTRAARVRRRERRSGCGSAEQVMTLPASTATTRAGSPRPTPTGARRGSSLGDTTGRPGADAKWRSRYSNRWRATIRAMRRARAARGFLRAASIITEGT